MVPTTAEIMSLLTKEGRREERKKKRREERREMKKRKRRRERRRLCYLLTPSNYMMLPVNTLCIYALCYLLSLHATCFSAMSLLVREGCGCLFVFPRRRGSRMATAATRAARNEQMS